MDPIVVSIAATAGRVIVQTMASDGWRGFRDRMAELMSRQSRVGPSQVATALDDSREAVISGSSSGEVMAIRWQGRLEAMLEESPESADRLVSLIHDSTEGPSASPISVRSEGTAGMAQIVQLNSGGGIVYNQHLLGRAAIPREGK
ncbi:hypothetical protein [Kitasatospora sp. NPDC057223]|uniref:hypothetical protein n=1 Tax=Kitasatospora sp. NPDC057223 TaxID=3346055 RepID=UPI00362E55EE